MNRRANSSSLRSKSFDMGSTIFVRNVRRIILSAIKFKADPQNFAFSVFSKEI